MAMLRVHRPGALFAGAALALMLGACGGGGGGSVSTPGTGTGAGTVQPPGGSGGSGTAGSGTLSFVVTIPSSTTTSSTSRTPKYVSPSTASITVTLAGQTTPLATENLSAGAPGCTATAAGTSCTVTVTAPAGSQTFAIATFDGPNGTGHQLSVAKVPASITASSTTSIPLALQGVVASVTALLGSSSVPAGAPASVSITIVAYDANQNIIVGPGNFSSPVTLALNDPSGNTTLSTNTVPAPGTSVSLNYNGNSVTAATVTPSINGTPGTAATFAPAGDAVSNFTTPNSVFYITTLAAGPDKNVWFSAYNGGTIDATFSSITPGGLVTVYNTNTPLSYVDGLAPSSDGQSLWFGDDNGDIGRVATGTGTVTYATSANTPCESSTTACGEIDFMVLGPDGNDWFSDCGYGYLGYVTPQGSIVEFDPTQLPGWPGGGSAPEQIAFDSAGNLYVADEEQDGIYKVTLSNDAPTGVTFIANPANCEVYALAIGPDGNPWFGDDCSNIGMVPASNFSSGSLLEWSAAALNNDDGFYLMTSSPGGLWLTDDEDNYVYQVANLSSVGASQPPSITPVPVFSSSDADAYAITLGPDNNIWTATDGDNNGITPGALARLIYGAPATQALSTKRASASLSRSLSHVKHKHSRRGRGRGPGAHMEMHGHPHRPKPI
jgi:hypothetical protein